MEPLGTCETRLRDGVAKGVFPGAAYCAGHWSGGEWRRFEGAVGRFTYCPESPAMRPDTRFDLASVSKCAGTTLLAMAMVQDDVLDLDAPVQTVLPLFAGKNKVDVTFRHLLLHRSGLRAGIALHRRFVDVEPALEAVLNDELIAAPDEKTTYSDLSMIVLWEALAMLTIDAVGALRSIWQRIRPNNTVTYGFADPRLSAPTERIEPWRLAVRKAQNRKFKPTGLSDGDEWIQGEVHDPSACVLGGYGGNAGLFATAADLGSLCEELLRPKLFKRETVAKFTTRHDDKSTRALGWDTRAAEGSSAGSRFSMRSFGHTGYTGTSVWIDPEAMMYSVLLTNRVHPTAANNSLSAFRPGYHDALAESIEKLR